MCRNGPAAFAQDVSLATGAATTIIKEGLIDCGRGTRVSAVGQIGSDDDTPRTVPADSNYQTAPHAPDLYNACAEIEPGSLEDVDFDAIEVFGAGGSEEFVAYVFADNYVELYGNGTLIVVDPVPFTSFNSNMIRFIADRPVGSKRSDLNEDIFHARTLCNCSALCCSPLRWCGAG